MPPIRLDRRLSVALQWQIYNQIAEDIRNGAIAFGARLPATRVLAKVLGVSRNTVLAAYDELAANDLIGGERGSCMRVKGPIRLPLAGSAVLKEVLRAANYPTKTIGLLDPDGNPLYLRLD